MALLAAAMSTTTIGLAVGAPRAAAEDCDQTPTANPPGLTGISPNRVVIAVSPRKVDLQPVYTNLSCPIVHWRAQAGRSG